MTDSELRTLIRSPLFQRLLSKGFWDAHHVDLVWRIDGKDVREEADWLKDVWYCLHRKRLPCGCDPMSQTCQTCDPSHP
jgi:hypothetical protein